MYIQIENNNILGSLQTMSEIDGGSEQTLVISGSVYLQRFHTLRTFITTPDDGLYTMNDCRLSVVIIGKRRFEERLGPR